MYNLMRLEAIIWWIIYKIIDNVLFHFWRTPCPSLVFVFFLIKGLVSNIAWASFDVNRLEAAVLDLAADDSGGLQKQKTTYHWDKVWNIDDFLLLNQSLFLSLSVPLYFFFKYFGSHWWQRSKKYIKLNNGDRVTASGKVLSSTHAVLTCIWRIE